MPSTRLAVLLPALLPGQNKPFHDYDRNHEELTWLVPEELPRTVKGSGGRKTCSLLTPSGR